MQRRMNKVGVIGSGAMGAGIAAIVANAGIPVVLLDMVPQSLSREQEEAGLKISDPDVRNSIVQSGFHRIRPPDQPIELLVNGIGGLGMVTPQTGLMTQHAEALVTIGNLEDHLDLLADADWIVEAIIEKPEPKVALMERLESIRKDDCIISTNTSGLPVASIVEQRSPCFKSFFLGTHFFNPPRYMSLLEIIPTPETSEDVVDQFVAFAETELGKKIVFCHDTPNFIANRITAMTVAFIAEYALKNGYTIQETDLLTGTFIGRSQTATFMLQDWVGVDVVSYVTQNLYDLVPDDPWRELLVAPGITGLRQSMLENGMFGVKSGQGFYRKTTGAEGEIAYMTLNTETRQHEKPSPPRLPVYDELIREHDIGRRLNRLFFETDPKDREAMLTWATVSNQLSYSAQKIPEITDNLLNLDNAMKWGFGYQVGPFALWDLLGVQRVTDRMKRESIPVPDWVEQMLAHGNDSFYRYKEGTPVGYYDVREKVYLPIPVDPRVMDRTSNAFADRDVMRNASAGLVDMGDGVLLLELRNPTMYIDEATINVFESALKLLCEDHSRTGMVIASKGEHFCLGVAPSFIIESTEKGVIESAGQRWQKVLSGFKRCSRPVVAAIHGRTECGGAEIAMAVSRVLAHSESKVGLLEVMAGLIPGGGGIKELVRRRIPMSVTDAPSEEQINRAREIFSIIYNARITRNALEAKEVGFLSENDRIVFSRDFLLFEAKQEVLKLGDTLPQPLDSGVFAGGNTIFEAIRHAETIEFADEQAKGHMVFIRDALATIIGGGRHAVPRIAEQEAFLDLEQQFFCQLCRTEQALAWLRANAT